MARTPAAADDALPINDWLLHEGRHLADGPTLLTALAKQLVAAGLPLARSSYHVRTLHPLVYGVSFYWHRDRDDVERYLAEHGVIETDLYQRSPIRLLFDDGADQVRQRLDLPAASFAFPLFAELQASGMTDYLALPLTFSNGKVHGSTWACDRPGGFAEDEIASIRSALPLFSLLLEVHLGRRIAFNLLDAYVGRRAGARILAGQITRGSGETIEAAIWFCDLRDFTAMSERLAPDALLDRLNQYFDCMASAITEHGGEILKFIGDAMLAIFPLAEGDACARALKAAIAARTAMAEEVNAARLADGEEPLRFGIALHVGQVMYGNIGAARRLDFTVIGPAVNLAARVEGLCRSLGPSLLLSDAFRARLADAPGRLELRSLGSHRLAGIARPVEVFTAAP